MKSRLFAVLFDDLDSGDAEAFAKDLAGALRLGVEDRDACLAMLPKTFLARTEDEEERLFEQLAANRQVERSRLERTLVVMEFLLQSFLSDNIPDADWLSWADDLADVGWIDASTRPVFEAMVAAIRSELVAEVEPETRRRRAAVGVLPVLVGCGITVEMRSVTEAPYRIGVGVKEYQPRVVDTTAVASIKIELDEGPFKDVYFQADESRLDYLIRSLEAAKKEIAALRGFLRLESPEATDG